MARLDFERLVVKAVKGIPEPFRAKMENVAVVVEDSPAGLIAAEADRTGRPATLHDVFMTHTGRSLDDDVEDEADDESE